MLKPETIALFVLAVFAMVIMLRRSAATFKPHRRSLPRERRRWSGLTRRAIMALRMRRP